MISVFLLCQKERINLDYIIVTFTHQIIYYTMFYNIGLLMYLHNDNTQSIHKLELVYLRLKIVDIIKLELFVTRSVM